MSDRLGDDPRQTSMSLGRLLLEIALDHEPRTPVGERTAPGAAEAVITCGPCRKAPHPAHAERSAETGEGRVGACGDRTSEWHRVFPGTLDQLAEVRRFVRLMANEHEAACLAELVACELSAHAVLHTRSGDPGGRFTLEVRFGPDEVLVAVSDPGSEREPAARPADVEAVSGRGLWMVELLSLHWGSERTETGRRTWAVLPVSDALPPGR